MLRKIKTQSKKRPPVKKRRKLVNAKGRAVIRKSARLNGPVKAVGKVPAQLSKLKHSMNKRKQKVNLDKDVSKLTPMKQRPKSFFPFKLNWKVKKIVTDFYKSGVVINTSICLGIAEGFVIAHDKTLLARFGGSITLDVGWARSLLSGLNMVKSPKTCGAKSRVTDRWFQELQDGFLNSIQTFAKRHDIPAQLVYSVDPTVLHYVPTGAWRMEEPGSNTVPSAGHDDTRPFTAVLTGTLSGDFLPVQLICHGNTEACHPKYPFPWDWHVTQSPDAQINKTSLSFYVEHILLRHMRRMKRELGLSDTQKSLCIIDVSNGKIGEDLCGVLKGHNVKVVVIPPSCADRLQPLQLSVQKYVKDKLKSKFQAWYADGIAEQLLRTSKSGDKSNCCLTPVDGRASVLKPLGARWIHEVYTDIKSDPNVVRQGFEKAGIVECLKD